MVKLVKKFIELYPNIWEQMDIVTHKYNNKSEFPNKHHLEGSVASHTLLVMMSALEYKEIEVDTLLKMILLLHDVGKAYSFSENDGLTKRSFAGHSVKSYEMSDEIIENLSSNLNLNISENQKNIILEVIKNHDFFIKNTFEDSLKKFDKEVVYYLSACNYFDNMGRVSDSELNIDLTAKLEILNSGIEYFEK